MSPLFADDMVFSIDDLALDMYEFMEFCICFDAGGIGFPGGTTLLRYENENLSPPRSWCLRLEPSPFPPVYHITNQGTTRSYTASIRFRIESILSYVVIERDQPNRVLLHLLDDRRDTTDVHVVTHNNELLLQRRCNVLQLVNTKTSTRSASRYSS